MKNCTSDSFCLVTPRLGCWQIQLCLEMIFVYECTGRKDEGCTPPPLRWEERKPAIHTCVMGQWSAADLTSSQGLSRFQPLWNLWITPDQKNPKGTLCTYLNSWAVQSICSEFSTLECPGSTALGGRGELSKEVINVWDPHQSTLNHRMEREDSSKKKSQHPNTKKQTNQKKKGKE